MLKQCNKCKIKKVYYADFCADNSRKSGFSTICKVCHCAYKSKKRQEKAEEVRNVIKIAVTDALFFVARGDIEEEGMR
jgi:hypothetical protein